MAAYLLTWNPQVWDWTDQHLRAVQIRRGDRIAIQWSTGNNRRIQPGDRLFLLKQGDPPRGIIGSGYSTTQTFEAPHFRDDRQAAGDTAPRVMFQFDSLLDVRAEQPLDTTFFAEPELKDVYWKTPASGIRINDRAAALLADLWSHHLNGQRPLRVGYSYTRQDLYDLLNVPEQSRGGDWTTGYHRHNGDWYVFANVGQPGRTGHDYENRWAGDALVWRGKTNSRIDHESIQSMLSDQAHVHIFTRTNDRAPFIYEGVATPSSPQTTVPVTITWQFNSAEHASPDVEPGEVTGAGRFVEGAVRKVTVNVYERDRGARRACLAHWGVSCTVCQLNFGERYGDIGENYIHVHHLTPLAATGTEYIVDPIAHLRPVCPNCHAMIHRTDPPMSIETLQQLLAERSRKAGREVT